MTVSCAWAPFAVWMAGLAACSVAQQDRVITRAPDGSEGSFGPVADYLEHRCGTIDCHGQAGRNLRIWGCDGMRLDTDAGESCEKSATSPSEHTATYASLVGLEPEVMSLVVQEHAADPERLTFVRKARGSEGHKGGQLIAPGDVQDHCVVSWLGDRTDTDSCKAALAYPMFPGLDAGPRDEITDAAAVDRSQAEASPAEASPAETSIGDAPSDQSARDADTGADAPAGEDARTREDARRN